MGGVLSSSFLQDEEQKAIAIAKAAAVCVLVRMV